MNNAEIIRLSNKKASEWSQKEEGNLLYTIYTKAGP